MGLPAQTTPSVHSLQLDEEEQLQIALALSIEDATQPGSAATAAAEDELLAQRLQEEEYAEAARHQHQTQTARLASGAHGGTAAGGGAALPAAAPQPATTQPASRPSAAAGHPGSSSAGSTRRGSGLMDSLRVASADAAQRISNGSSQLWRGLQRMVDPQQTQAPPPPYPPPVVHHPHHVPQQPYPQQTPTQYPPAFPHAAPAGRPGWQASPPPQPQQQPRPQLSEDEALAHALQQQFDLEEQQMRRQQQQHAAQAPPVTGPLGANLAATTAAAAAAAGRPPAGASQPPPAAPSQPVAAAPARPPARPQAAVDRRRCAGCGGSLFGLLGARSPYISALGHNWHPGCLVCAGCSRPIGERGGVPFCEREGRLYHLDCHRAAFHPKCDVCANYCPEEANRRVVWSELQFWRQRFCPHHATDGTPRCTSCERLQPAREAGAWAELEDGRHICLPCLDTITTDTRDAQPLWQNVLSFFASLGMPLPSVPPMMLVDSGALNDAEGQETGGRGRGGGPVFHVRGLTLTEEYRSIRTILRIPGGNPFSVQRQAVPVGPTHTEVTGILVLYGLPRLLTGSILAHECMHAWLRMSGFTTHQHLPEQVEEGLCQLVAYLWLEAQQGLTGFKDGYEERLAAFFAHQIRSDTSAVYGDGFRLAHEAFQAHGLQALLAHVQRHAAFPP